MLPREKAKLYGITNLSDQELLALVLESANRNKSVFNLADDLLTYAGSLARLVCLDYAELCSLKGIKEAKAYSLLAIFEIYKRLLKVHKHERVDLKNPLKVANWLRCLIGYASQENFVVLFLNNHCELLKEEILFKGSDESSLVSIKEVMRKALLYRCTYLLIAHNHPSGHIKPSLADKQITEDLKLAAEYLGLKLADHLIVSPENYFSFKEENLL